MKSHMIIVGHKVILVQPNDLPSIQHYDEETKVTVPLTNLVIGKAENYQKFLDTIQPRDPKERVVFSKLGSDKDGYTHTVLKVFGKHIKGFQQQSPLSEVITLNAQTGSLIDSLKSSGKLEENSFKTFYDTLIAAHSLITGYLITKVLGNDKDSQVESLLKGQAVKTFADLATNDLGDVLDRTVEDPLIYAYLHGLSTIGSNENLPLNECSGYGLASMFSVSDNGLYYPQ
eukprot:gene21445-27778_t